MQDLYLDNKDAGLMVVTVLTEDANRNVPDQEDCQEWADQYGATHPILGDLEGFGDAAMADGIGYPFSLLIDRGMEVVQTDEGTRSITEEMMQEYL